MLSQGDGAWEKENRRIRSRAGICGMSFCARRRFLGAGVLLTLTFLHPSGAVPPAAPASGSTASPAPSAAAQPDGKDKIVALTDAQIASILSAAIPADFPIKDIGVSFSGQQAHISASAQRDALIKYLENSGAEIPPIARAGLKLLGEDTAIGMVFKLPETANGAVNLDPVSISVGGIRLDAGLIPGALVRDLNEGLNSAAGYYGGVIKRVYIDGGMLNFEFE